MKADPRWKTIDLPYLGLMLTRAGLQSGRYKMVIPNPMRKAYASKLPSVIHLTVQEGFDFRFSKDLKAADYEKALFELFLVLINLEFNTRTKTWKKRWHGFQRLSEIDKEIKLAELKTNLTVEFFKFVHAGGKIRETINQHIARQKTKLDALIESRDGGLYSEEVIYIDKAVFPKELPATPIRNSARSSKPIYAIKHLIN